MEYSDAPLRVNGVKYFPKWAWSADYRKWFRASFKKPSRPNGYWDHLGGYLLWLQKARNLTSEEAIAYAKERGLTTPVM